MKEYILLIICLLLIPFYGYATDGVNTVEHPAKVNSVATPDKVCGVSGLAAAGGTTCSGNYGETADGTGNTQAAGWTWLIKTSFDCAADANDTTFNLRINDANGPSLEVVMLIYADNAGEPGALVWEGPRGDGISYDSTWDSAQWINNTVDVELSGTYLWIGFHFEHTASTYFYTSNDPARTTRNITNAGAFPDVDANWDVDNDATSEYGFACYLSY